MMKRNEAERTGDRPGGRVQLTDIARFESGVSQGPKSQPRSLPEVPRNTFASVMIVVVAAGRELINNETDDL